MKRLPVLIDDVAVRPRTWSVDLWMDYLASGSRGGRNRRKGYVPPIPDMRFEINAVADDALYQRVRRRCRRGPLTVVLGRFTGPAFCEVRREGASITVKGAPAGPWRLRR